MNKSENHIDIFEELVRILSLKKSADFDSFETTLKSLEIKYIPHNEKKSALIDELVEQYNKIRPKKNSGRKTIILLFSGIFIASGIFFFSKHCNQNTLQPPATIKAQDTNIEEKSISVNNTNKKNNSNPIQNTEKSNHQIKTSKNLLADTVMSHTKINDTIKTKKEKTDSINRSTKIKPGYYCLLPEEYKFNFEVQSIKLDKKYEKNIVDLSEKITNCQNIKRIKVTSYYTRKFLIFNTKEFSSKRINEIIKQLKRLHVPLKTIKEIEIELLLTNKKNNPELLDLIKVELTPEK